MDSATQVGVTLGELVAVAVLIVGALWALGKLGVAQFKATIDQRFAASDQKADARFATIDEKLKSFDPLHGELARVDKDLVQVRLEMATNFVRQDGLRYLQTRMEELFTEVFARLDNKVDKSECERVHK